MRALVLSIALAACNTSAAKTPTPPPIADMPPTPALIEPMSRLAFMRGVWQGPASGTSREGKPYEVTQTERMGPMLGGDIIVIEGRGYAADGTTAFNAFGVVSYDQFAGKYEIRSYTQGMQGTFEMRLTDTGYIWEIPAGPGAVVRFTATITGGNQWREVGEYIAPGAPPVQTFEMNLRRVGDTDWPRGTPIPSPATAAGAR